MRNNDSCPSLMFAGTDGSASAANVTNIGDSPRSGEVPIAHMHPLASISRLLPVSVKQQTKSKSRIKPGHLACNTCRRRRIRCVLSDTSASTSEQGSSRSPKCVHCTKVGAECIFSGQDLRKEPSGSTQPHRTRLQATAQTQIEPVSTPRPITRTVRHCDSGSTSTEAADLSGQRQLGYNFTGEKFASGANSFQLDPVFASYCHLSPVGPTDDNANASDTVRNTGNHSEDVYDGSTLSSYETRMSPPNRSMSPAHPVSRTGLLNDAFDT
jgi:hypothetical protein